MSFRSTGTQTCTLKVAVAGKRALFRKVSSAAYPNENPPRCSYILKSLNRYSSVCSGEAAFLITFPRVCINQGMVFLVFAKFLSVQLFKDWKCKSYRCPYSLTQSPCSICITIQFLVGILHTDVSHWSLQTNRCF